MEDVVYGFIYEVTVKIVIERNVDPGVTPTKPGEREIREVTTNHMITSGAMQAIRLIEEYRVE